MRGGEKEVCLRGRGSASGGSSELDVRILTVRNGSILRGGGQDGTESKTAVKSIRVATDQVTGVLAS